MSDYVVAFFERDEFRSRDLSRRTLRLVVEVDISGRCVDKASDLPRPKIFGDRAFSNCCAPCCLDGSGVVVEPPRPQRVREPGTGERFQRLDERLQATFPSRLGQSLRDGTSKRAVGIDSIRLLAADNERQYALGRMFADPEAEPAPP